MNRAVHVAGRGAVTAFGRGRAAFLEALASGASAIRRRERLTALDLRSALAAEVPAEVAEVARGGGISLVLGLAKLAAEEALAESHGKTRGVRAALVLATTKADISGLERDGSGTGSPAELALQLLELLRLRGRAYAVSCACASGTSALAFAGRLVAGGQADTALVVAADALSAFVLRGFDALLLLDPERSRPFDRSRAGLSLGEGAGALVLTREERASLGVRLCGWAETNDASHLTAPRADGAALARAVAAALARAGTGCADVDAISLHGTGTAANDAAEAAALALAFGGSTPPGFGVKGALGHTLGAAGVLESIALVEVLRSGTSFGNVGLTESGVDPNLTLALARAALPRARAALKVASGFGGIDAALVFRT